MGTTIQETRLQNPNTPSRIGFTHSQVPYSTYTSFPTSSSDTTFPFPSLHENLCGVPITTAAPIECS